MGKGSWRQVLDQETHQFWNLVKAFSCTKGMLLSLSWRATTLNVNLACIQMCPSTSHSPGV